jgi:hypothetical protein
VLIVELVGEGIPTRSTPDLKKSGYIRSVQPNEPNAPADLIGGGLLDRGRKAMKLIEIVREPCVLCPKTNGVVLVSECQSCKHFYGYNIGETKIGCVEDKQ